jgi:hypothetical protein
MADNHDYPINLVSTGYQGLLPTSVYIPTEANLPILEANRLEDRGQ